jgi:hypothetical protein
MAGYSGKPLVQKLGIQAGFCIFIEGAPAAYGDIVGPLPADVTVAKWLKAPLDMVHLFAKQAAGLTGRLRGCRDAIEPDGMIWVSWPKKSSGVATDLTDVVVRDTALPLGLVDIKVCAIDDVRIEIRDPKRSTQIAPRSDLVSAVLCGRVRKAALWSLVIMKRCD